MRRRRALVASSKKEPVLPKLCRRRGTWNDDRSVHLLPRFQVCLRGMGSGQQATRSSATQHLSKCADKKSSQIIGSLSWFLVAAPFVLCEDASRADTPCGQIIRSRMSVRQWFLCRKGRGDRGGRCFCLHTLGVFQFPSFWNPHFKQEKISQRITNR